MAARGSLCLPHVRQTLAGSTKVLGRDEAAKKPPESVVVASAVAFMGPKWRRPPVFYFSSMMAAAAEALATDSSLSAHPAFVAACMARPPAWESRPQKRKMQYEAAAWTTATTLVHRSSSSWPDVWALWVHGLHVSDPTQAAHGRGTFGGPGRSEAGIS